ncbi:hypothetical protein NLY34_00015 [Mesorhizobium sp. C374B]|nr:hypothetical protein [Mesorhizobium sp. C374B]WJI81195.1 hypothetical protein NLY34_00015 [Mesorhizobium sp. C374B]
MIAAVHLPSPTPNRRRGWRSADGDDNRNALALAHGGDRINDCSFAFRVEMGIGFIQHDKERVSIKGPGKTDKLTLPRKVPIRPHQSEFRIRAQIGGSVRACPLLSPRRQ